MIRALAALLVLAAPLALAQTPAEPKAKSPASQKPQKAAAPQKAQAAKPRNAQGAPKAHAKPTPEQIRRFNELQKQQGTGR